MSEKTLNSPAKINLFLRVADKLPNGYHELETLFLPIEGLTDKISVSFNHEPGIKIESSHANIPLDGSNLCWKAADLYAQKAGIEPDWKIFIDKKIPVAAGMGGGSSDAAAVLRLLQAEYKALTPEDLSAIAIKIGADVPFFLNPCPAIGSGVGEKLKLLDFEIKIPLIIVAPMFPVSAAWAYQHNTFKFDETDGLDSLLEALKKQDWQACGKLLRNDLAPALFKKFPLLNILKEELLELGVCGVEISGSGPTLFAVCRDFQNASSIAEKLGTRYLDSGIGIFCPE